MADDDSDGLRASDAERERAVTRLREASVEGRLAFEEFLDRMSAAYQATTRGELSALVGDLPVPEAVPARRERTTVLSVFGGNDKAGRWTVPARVTVLNLFGGSDLDLRQASVPGDVDLAVYSLFGGSDITVPAGTDVEVSGGAVFGGNDLDLTTPPVPGSPRIRVRMFSVFGGTDVKDHPRRRWRDMLGGAGDQPRPPLPPPTGPGG